MWPRKPGHITRTRVLSHFPAPAPLQAALRARVTEHSGKWERGHVAPGHVSVTARN